MAILGPKKPTILLSRVSRYEIPYLVSKNHVHTSTYGTNWVKTKISGGHSPDPTLKIAVLGPKKPKNCLIYYYRYLKKWFYKKFSLVKVAQKNFFLE